MKAPNTRPTGQDSSLTDTLVRDRRDFHAHPETRWTEFRTSAKVARRLEDLGFAVHLGADTTTGAGAVMRPSSDEIEEHLRRARSEGAPPELLARMGGIPGVVGELALGGKGPTLAFRFDMDALAGQEASGDDHRPWREGFASRHDGCVHACGHDGHTAIGLGFADRLMAQAAGLGGTVRLIFQPSEEGGGGAAGIVDEGWLDDVDAFYAVHLCLAHDGRPMGSGEIGAGSVDFLDSRRFDVHYQGRAAHPCGDPQRGRNALLAACEACSGIFAIPPHGEGMLRVNVGTLTAGTARNTIAANASFTFEVRGEHGAIADEGQERALRIVQGYATAHGVHCEIVDAGRTPSGRSDAESIALIEQAAAAVPWFEHIHPHAQVGGSDDATEMMNRVQSQGGKAAYIGIGADLCGGLHASNFDFDEDAMPATVSLLLALVRTAGVA